MRTKKGIITSAKMTGTVAVTVHRHAFHPIYKKRFRRSSKFLCDTNGLDLHEGDEVMIAETAPLSKRKYFKVTEIIKAAPQVAEMHEGEALEKVIHREKIKPANNESSKKKSSSLPPEASAKGGESSSSKQ